MSPFWVAEKSRAANHIFIQTFPFCTMWRRINCKNNPLSLLCWLKKVSLETELNPAKNIRAGHTTTLPRQRDHVFRRNIRAGHATTLPRQRDLIMSSGENIRAGHATTLQRQRDHVFRRKTLLIIALLYISTFFRATPPRPQHFSNSITVALSLSRSWEIFADQLCELHNT